MQRKGYKYVFGPVPSRRLGRSLGVDLVRFKTCPYDCVYCQLGPTSTKTAKRDAYVPTEEVLAELAAKLADKPACDYITLRLRRADAPSRSRADYRCDQGHD